MKTGQLLTLPEVEPTSDLLRDELGRLFPIYEDLTATLESSKFGISPEWRFYKDGGAWLCKMTRKKKTVFWLSAWQACLKCGFYFTTKSAEGISALSIDPSLKSAFANAVPIGKLYPLVVELQTKKQLKDVCTLASFKLLQK